MTRLRIPALAQALVIAAMLLPGPLAGGPVLAQGDGAAGAGDPAAQDEAGRGNEPAGRGLGCASGAGAFRGPRLPGDPPAPPGSAPEPTPVPSFTPESSPSPDGSAGELEPPDSELGHGGRPAAGVERRARRPGGPGLEPDTDRRRGGRPTGRRSHGRAAATGRTGSRPRHRRQPSQRRHRLRRRARRGSFVRVRQGDPGHLVPRPDVRDQRPARPPGRRPDRRVPLLRLRARRRRAGGPFPRPHRGGGRAHRLAPAGRRRRVLASQRDLDPRDLRGAPARPHRAHLRAHGRAADHLHVGLHVGAGDGRVRGIRRPPALGGLLGLWCSAVAGERVG